MSCSWSVPIIGKILPVAFPKVGGSRSVGTLSPRCRAIGSRKTIAPPGELMHHFTVPLSPARASRRPFFSPGRDGLPLDRDVPAGRLQVSGQDLQRCRLPGAVNACSPPSWVTSTVFVCGHVVTREKQERGEKKRTHERDDGDEGRPG